MIWDFLLSDEIAVDSLTKKVSLILELAFLGPMIKQPNVSISNN